LSINLNHRHLGFEHIHIINTYFLNRSTAQQFHSRHLLQKEYYIMPIAPVLLAEIGNFVIFGSAIGGSIGGCFESGECKREAVKPDLLNTEEVPRMRFMPRQAEVGPCNVPKYNFDQCNDQLKTVTVTGTIPAAGGKSLMYR
jgi:hypothetical protein